MQLFKVFLFYYALIATTTLLLVSYFLFARYLLKSAPTSDTTLNEIKQGLIESYTSDAEFRSRLEDEIATLRIKIDTLGNRDLNVIGLTTPSENPTLPQAAIGQITAKDANLTRIAIYEKSNQQSKSVGSAEYGVVYPFYEKSGDWYKISQGWVEARWFTEN